MDASFTFARDQTFWDNVSISPGALLVESLTLDDGKVSKKFGLQPPGNFAVSFYIPDNVENDVNDYQLNAWSYDSELESSYETIQASGSEDCDYVEPGDAPVA